MISLIQHFEADFLWKVSLKIQNSGIIRKTLTHALKHGRETCVHVILDWILGVWHKGFEIIGCYHPSIPNDKMKNILLLLCHHYNKLSDHVLIKSDFLCGFKEFHNGKPRIKYGKCDQAFS